jgi:hypothetical protein
MSSDKVRDWFDELVKDESVQDDPLVTKAVEAVALARAGAQRIRFLEQQLKAAQQEALRRDGAASVLVDFLYEQRAGETHGDGEEEDRPPQSGDGE